jgi:hypothetical protein
MRCANTPTESKGYGVDTTGIDDSEVFHRIFWIRAVIAVVAKLNAESELLKGDIGEESAIPLLESNRIPSDGRLNA